RRSACCCSETGCARTTRSGSCTSRRSENSPGRTGSSCSTTPTPRARSSRESSNGLERIPDMRVLGVVLLCLAAWTAAPSSGGTSECAPTPADELASIGTATQLVTVSAPRESSSRGTVQLWQKTGECWVAAGGPWAAWLGQRGVSEERHEGDR